MEPNEIARLRGLHEDYIRFEGGIHGGTGSGLTNCYSYQDGHHDFAEWLIDGFGYFLDDIEKLQAENTYLRKELTTLAIEIVNREKTLAKLEAEVMAAAGLQAELEASQRREMAAAGWQEELEASKRMEMAAVKDLKYYLESNEENGVVYIPKFVIERMVKLRGPEQEWE